METAKRLYRRLDSLFGRLEQAKTGRLDEGFLKEAFATLREDLHLRSGLLYVEQRDDFALRHTVGEPGGPVPDSLTPQDAALGLILRHGVYIFGDAEGDATTPRLAISPRGAAAALVAGRRPDRRLFVFLLTDGWSREELDFTLNTLRAALGSRLADARARGRFREAAEIQQSLLMEEAPAFHGYDIACRSVAAEEVGGDFFDFYSVDDELLGLAVGDASGHGLPAALLVRDVVTGLRMGIEEHLKLSHVFTKLNRVIHRSSLSSRFISVFYGELEKDGNLVYVNAGHNPPMLFTAGKDEPLELDRGGTVIGPVAEVRFARGFARIRPGDVLVMPTDGILERRNAAGEFFGLERLHDIVRRHRGGSSEEILSSIFSASDAFGDGRPWEDDATLVVLKRGEGGA
jgi:sigma-B regulation protein RsbU (phosphoserine phosphatase)